MNCADFAGKVHAYVDGEMGGDERTAVERHLATCADCASARAAILRLRERIRAEVPQHAAPESLRARVLDALPAAAAKHTRSALRTSRARWLALGALAGCAATLVAWLLGNVVLEWQEGRNLAREAVSAHVRATLSDRLVQVASSDRHTVKPWMSSRLDYSPPVRDLAGDGFPLVGGRLDYIDGRPVATLVYRYREHVIDVFVRPLPARPPPADEAAVRGFNLAHATGAAMDWLAVSDVSADVLRSFVDQLSREAATP
jgi:mycothiol system anti-sigma-R factor